MSNLKINLEPRSIALCPNPDLPSGLAQAFMNQTLQHQVDVYKAAETNDIILDLAPTGTGKTKAGLSVLHHNRDRNAVYIAPTNALIEQQTEAAEKFVRDAGLPHIVKAASARHIKSWRDDLVGNRSGEKLYNVLREPATIFPECGGGRPILLVTNPDIFYYATFFAYNKLDRGNIASEFYNSFSTVIFDEFHLYDAKQLVSLFFYLALSKIFNYFQYNRKVVLLTATPEPACEAALEVLKKSGVRISSSINGESQTDHLTPSQTAVNLEIRKQLDRDALINDIANEVVQRLQNYPEHNGAVILDSKDILNRLSDNLRARGLEDICGRITGSTPIAQRQKAAQKQVILATSTVDVGFNFEREVEPERQNLDWLIFSTRDRFSFWQRLGRVGRVLGKKQTDIPSEAIAYLPEQAWEQGIENLDCSGGREALKEMLESLDCMKRPFLDIYWRSEAFLEIAKPLLELETFLEELPDDHLVIKLYQTLQEVLKGKRKWEDYQKRMKVLKGAEDIARKTVKEIQKDWKYVKGGQSFVMSYLRAYCPEDYEEIKTGRASFKTIEEMIKKEQELAKDIQKYAVILKASYAPLFRFRDSLFGNVKIYDPHNLLLDEVGETNLDPIHLLRFYEFESDGDRIEVTARVDEPYNLAFSLQVSDLQDFKNTLLCKLYAFENCSIKRMHGDVVRPTPSIIEKQLIPGVIVSETAKNRWAIVRLRKQGLECYPIYVSSYDCPSPKQYTFFPSLSGILAIASAGVALKCPDEEDFWVI
ncbi:type I-D CRISPR-associated helicase Cas3' [Allocoleopsis franciscana]|uniref:CRISPR-associated helicase, Cas3 family n=1 Tax=Allocoleopsis franciscana PCC 7113 TaxID=1173027 RepID=K9WHX2_9CYAN|nr:type I-D CRISPR-associated helicase Cas3' [Allocoleopsis franciscana]AFZ19097.1 CRISPR-associated helicase, Cas3 family [Allocoleopsis franciscana PCC 7113]